jgi:hypothetical protein
LTIQAVVDLTWFSWLRLVGKTHLTHYIKVIFSSHKWVGESMISDIMPSIESGHKLIWVIKDVTTDHKMRRYLIIWLQKLHKGGGKLNWMMRDEYLAKKLKQLTAVGPSSKALAKTPSGASHISPGILHP